MACCGKARATVRAEYASVTQGTATAQPKPPGVTIRYLGESTVLIRGPRTGRAYMFYPGESSRDVDPRDAEVLLRMDLFRRADSNG
jgi:hypothetical protein